MKRMKTRKRQFECRKILTLLLAAFCALLLNVSNVSAKEAKDANRVRIPFNDSRVTYSEGWNNYQDEQMYTNTVGSKVTVEFEGTGFAILGGLAKNGPIATVEIDGIVEDADFFDPNGTGAEGKVYERRGLKDGKHTAIITFSDRTNPDISDGFASYQIAIYAFEELKYPNVFRNVTVEGGTAEAEQYSVGSEVHIKADKPADGEYFVKWETDDVTLVDEYAESTSFVMPNKDVEIKAVFEKKRTEPKTFYIDSENGNDKADGNTPKTAWKTLSKLNQMEFIEGDRILLRAGSVFEDQSLSIKGSGSKAAPIVVDMYDGDVIGIKAGERPHIKGNGKNAFEYQGNQISYGLHIENVSFVQINNVEISNQGETRKLSVGVCVEAAGCGVMQGVYMNNVYIHDVNGTYEEKTLPNGGLYYVVSDHSNNTRFHDIKIENCSVKRVSRTGISVGMTASYELWDGHGGRIPKEILDAYGHTEVAIRNNYVEEAGGDAIVPMFSIKPIIEYNISNGASQNTKHTSMYNAGIWPWRCEDAVFQFNECYGTILNGDGQAYDCDWSRGTVYQYNYSHDNEGGFILICKEEALESVIRYNVSQNDKRCLFLTSNPNNADIYNNTFYIGEGLNTAVVEDAGGKATLKNNIFYNLGDKKETVWGKNYSYENNLYYGFDNLPNDSKKIIADPLFVDPGKGGEGSYGNSANDTLDGYQLQKNSPAIDAGLTIANNGGRDYFGNELKDGKTDIGAAEYVAVDKSKLENLVSNAQKYEKELEKYTSETGGIFKEALEAARQVLADGNATQQEVDLATSQLQSAIDGLIVKTQSGDDNKPDTDNENSEPEEQAPVTSDTSDGVGYMMLALAAMMVVLGKATLGKRKIV